MACEIAKEGKIDKNTLALKDLGRTADLSKNENWRDKSEDISKRKET